MEAVARPAPRSISAEWADEATRVTVARAQSWRDSAFLSLAAHSVALQRPVREGSIPELTRRATELRHHLSALVHARREIGDALHALANVDLPQQLASQRDAVELACADLDAYIERNRQVPQEG